MNEKTLGLIRASVKGILFILGIYLIVVAMGSDATIDPETREIIEEVDDVSGAVNYALYMVYAVLAIIGVFIIFGAIVNPKRFLKSLIGVGVFGVIVLIAYMMASPEAVGRLANLEGATADNLKMTDAGILATFILVIVAIALIIFQTLVNVYRYFVK